MGEVLDVPYGGDKGATMQALVEAVGMVRVLSAMASRVRGVVRGVQPQRAAGRRRAVNEHAEPFEPGVPDVAQDEAVLASIRRRRGQALLLEAYEGPCAISGCDAPAALEAAHIVPYDQGGT